MKLLVLGGTQFLGRHLVEQALARDHEVTTFNRGRTNPTLFDGQVEKIIGDRDDGLDSLKGRHFDACIDPSGYLPRQVQDSCGRLKDVVGHYTFVSSISVYPKFWKGMDESAPVTELEDPTVEDVEKYYGGLKVLCERKAEDIMPGRVLQVRSGLIIGAYDPTDRFTYWPLVIRGGNSFLAPVHEDFPLQVIDARDQAVWILESLEKNLTGVFHVTGEESTFAELISACETAFDVKAQPHWASEKFLLDNDVSPWVDLPMWLPEAAQGMLQVSVAKAFENGLSTRPLAETIQDLIEWHHGDRDRLSVGLKRAREKELLSLLMEGR